MSTRVLNRQLAGKITSSWILSVMLCCLLLQGCASSGFVAVEKKFGRQSAPIDRNQYQVKAGDTLFGIALQLDMDFKQLAKANHILRPYTIFPGQILTLKMPSKASTNIHKPPRAIASKTSNKPQSDKANPQQLTTHPANTSSKLQQNKKIKWHWPIKGKLVAKYSAVAPINKGIDIQGKLGQSVRAAAAGKVVFAGTGPRGYGQLVIIDHNDRYLSAYANNQKVLVKENDLVQARQEIAHLGARGSLEQARLHFEVRRQGKPLNPLKLLPASR